jgi:hypothetical protein
MTRCCLCALLFLLAFAAKTHAAGFDRISRQFLDSDFIFGRTHSDVPFVPLAWLEANAYQDSHILDQSFRQTSLSEATLLPVLLGPRDALLVGQWGTWTRFEADGSHRDTAVTNITLPIGWARQASPQWQLAAFVAPSANHSDGQWYWDYMGGVFARYVGTPRFAWLFGVYAEIAHPEELFVPYVGVTWTIDRHWTLSAILPWPAVLYSPTPDWLLRLGLAPSSASWIADIPATGESPQRLRADFTSWDLGLRVEKRAWKSLWVGAEAGLSGFRGLAFSGGDRHSPSDGLGNDPYLTLTMTFRPALARTE